MYVGNIPFIHISLPAYSDERKWNYEKKLESAAKMLKKEGVYLVSAPPFEGRSIFEDNDIKFADKPAFLKKMAPAIIKKAAEKYGFSPENTKCVIRADMVTREVYEAAKAASALARYIKLDIDNGRDFLKDALMKEYGVSAEGTGYSSCGAENRIYINFLKHADISAPYEKEQYGNAVTIDLTGCGTKRSGERFIDDVDIAFPEEMEKNIPKGADRASFASIICERGAVKYQEVKIRKLIEREQ